MSMVETERVLVVPTEIFHALGHFQGFCTEVDKYLQPLLHCEHASYRSRDEMEQDPSFKQLIPYMIFRHVSDSGESHIFQYLRGSGQGEARLHRKVSVGVGGHISSIDDRTDGSTAYEEGMRRELEEEVHVETSYRSKIVGLINDDETEVGKVHLGVVHLMEVDQPQVTPREADIMEAGFRPLAETMARLDSMESWSRICMEALFG